MVALNKVCTKCGIEKPVSEFGTANATKRDGYNSWCKQCVRDASKRHRDTASGIYSQIKGRTNFRRNNDKRYRTYHPLNISREDFIKWYNGEPKTCVYCDLPENLMNSFFDSYNYIADRLTIDCKDNDLGYAKGNLVLACKRCNSIKSDLFSFEEMCEIGEKFIKPKWQLKIQGSKINGR